MKYIILNKITKARWEADDSGMRLIYNEFTLVSVIAALNKTGKYEDSYLHIIVK
jgi:hypothetical protein